MKHLRNSPVSHSGLTSKALLQKSLWLSMLPESDASSFSLWETGEVDRPASRLNVLKRLSSWSVVPVWSGADGSTGSTGETKGPTELVHDCVSINEEAG